MLTCPFDSILLTSWRFLILNRMRLLFIGIWFLFIIQVSWFQIIFWVKIKHIFWCWLVSRCGSLNLLFIDSAYLWCRARNVLRYIAQASTPTFYLSNLLLELFFETLFANSHLTLLSCVYLVSIRFSKVFNQVFLFLNFLIILLKHLFCFAYIEYQALVFNLKALYF